MTIMIGSKNPTKINAVLSVFSGHKITSLDAQSHVAKQPFSDEETRQGAINRAKDCIELGKDSVGIGLEGGVMELSNHLYLCNWGALVTRDGQEFTASGARIILPHDIAVKLNRGVELGDVMDQFTQKTGVRNKEGAIGIFTNDLISRESMFIHVVTLLKGQWDYFKNEQ